MDEFEYWINRFESAITELEKTYPNIAGMITLDCIEDENKIQDLVMELDQIVVLTSQKEI